MPEQTTGVTPGAGVNLHGWQRTISGLTNPVDEFVIPGEYPYPSFVAVAQAISTATAASHLLQIMAAANVYLRIRRIEVHQHNSVTTAGIGRVQVVRLTTAGTGGSALTPAPFDTADTAASSAMTLPTVKGTEGAVWRQATLNYRQTPATAGGDLALYTWEQHPGTKPLIVPAGTANGIAIKLVDALAAGGLTVQVEYVETTFTG